MPLFPKIVPMSVVDYSEYNFEGVAGNGAYGHVHIATLNNDTKAIKKLRIPFDVEIPSVMLREVSILKELRHENIVELLTFFVKGSRNYLVFDYYREDLSKLIDKYGPLEPQKAKWIVYQLLQALHFIHKKGFIHRDIKPGNVLLDGDKVKLCDFGMARPFDRFTTVKMTNQVATSNYRSLELLLGSEEYNYGIDIWSVGALIYEVLTGLVLFQGAMELDVRESIFKILGTPTNETFPALDDLKLYTGDLRVYRGIELEERFQELNDPLAADLLNQMFSYNWKSRISARQALDHPFFAEFNN